jgi:hypothetical protein
MAFQDIYARARAMLALKLQQQKGQQQDLNQAEKSGLYQIFHCFCCCIQIYF